MDGETNTLLPRGLGFDSLKVEGLRASQTPLASLSHKRSPHSAEECSLRIASVLQGIVRMRPQRATKNMKSATVLLERQGKAGWLINNYQHEAACLLGLDDLATGSAVPMQKSNPPPDETFQKIALSASQRIYTLPPHFTW